MNALMELLRRHCADDIIALAEALMDRCHPVRVRFAGIYYHNQHGELVMATQHIPINTPSTAPLIFTDASGATVAGPTTGTVSTSDPANSTVTLSANGQFVNVTLTGATLATLTYSSVGVGGATITATVDVTDEPVPSTATGVAFGTFAAGTTA